MGNGYHKEYRPENARPSKEHISAKKIAHMVGVAAYMRDRADDYGVDGNVAYTAGLLHDIGYLEGQLGHEEIGAEILEACGMRGEIVFAVANHATKLSNIPEDQISPILVLMVEADLSVDARGFRVGFEDRLKDIAKRHGVNTMGNVNNEPIYQNVLSNVEYIKAYQAEHGIPTQEAALNHKADDDYINHGSGKWVGSDTKAELMKQRNNAHKGKDITE